MVAIFVRLGGSILVIAGTVLFGSSAEASGSIRIRYAPPKAAVHQSIYDALRQKRVLERVRDGLQGLHLPRPLTLNVEGCDGDINAAYDSSDTSLTICYEYLAYIQELARDIPPAGVKEGLTPANYVVGPFLEVVLHEIAHAVFDLNKVPILGREEDAADQVAAFLLLRLGKGELRRVIASIATMYASEAKEAPSKLKDFADEHGLPAQRLFNLLCISYGADPKTFGDLVEKGYLPPERAEQCDGEYRQVKFAFDRLIAPRLGNPTRARRGTKER
jgi:Putative metallopeptidase